MQKLYIILIKIQIMHLHYFNIHYENFLFLLQSFLQDLLHYYLLSSPLDLDLHFLSLLHLVLYLALKNLLNHSHHSPLNLHLPSPLSLHLFHLQNLLHPLLPFLCLFQLLLILREFNLLQLPPLTLLFLPLLSL